MQQTLEDGLRTVLRLAEPPGLVVAGRTDAGVHATHQVAHVDLPTGALPEAAVLVRRLRGVLPDDVRVHAVALAPAGFDARFSALRRAYRYRLCDADSGPPPLRRHDVVAHPRPLDVAAMERAAAPLLGEHDFLPFCRPRAGATTVRELQALTVRRETELVVVTVVADAFCHHMVRALVGALVAVGDGRRELTWPGRLLADRQRTSSVTVMPAHGLTLEAVDYPPDDELAQRATSTRRRRDQTSAPGGTLPASAADPAVDPAAEPGDPHECRR